MDYREFLSQIDDETVDLAIIDPPYNLGIADWDTFASHDEFISFTYNWLDMLLPKLKMTGSLYVFNTPYNAAFILQYLVSLFISCHFSLTFTSLLFHS